MNDVQIIPSINVPTFEEVQERVKQVEPYVSWCHLDVTDGMFTKHLTWHNPMDLPLLTTNLKAEVHLMVNEPEKLLDYWLVRPVKRIIVHLEAVTDMQWIIDRCHTIGVEIGIAIRPETFWGLLEPWLEKVDMVQTLGVNPGPSGQQVQEEVFDKIAHIRKRCPKCLIEFDGGVNKDTAKRGVEAGASVLVAWSAIMESKDIKKAIEDLKNSTSIKP